MEALGHTRRSGRTRRALLVATALLVGAAPARAERGALTIEAGAGPSLTLLAAPYVESGARAFSVGLAPTLAIRYAPSHDLELGVRAGLQPPGFVSYDGGAYDEKPTRLDHAFAAGSLALVARVYLGGLDWRFYAEALAGWGRRTYASFDRCLLTADGGCASLGLPLPDFVSDDLLLGAAPGLEYVWDHAAVGVRIPFAIRWGPDVAWSAGLAFTASYAFYP